MTRTPLHLSCEHLLADYVPILLEHKAQVNAVDGHGKVPLNHLAGRTEPAARELEQLLLAQID